MFKSIVALSAVIIALPLLASTETITHRVKKDSLVKRGTVIITNEEVKEETVLVKFEYSVLAKVLFFERVLEGVKEVELPARYLNEYGYEALEEVRRMEDKTVTAIHLGRTDLPNHYDCHMVKIIPKGGKKWDGVFTYCPDIPSLGFARTQISMREIPWVGEHTINTYIVE